MKKDVIKYLKKYNKNDCVTDFLNSKFYKNINEEYNTELIKFLSKYDKNEHIYELMFNRNIFFMKKFLADYYSKSSLSKTKFNNSKKDFGTRLFHNAFYVDVDEYAVKKHNNCNVICKGDALFSFNRIISFNDYAFSNKMIKDYELLRDIVIFYFPSERGGINTSRMNSFDDKIDYLLFDLNNYLNNKPCRLSKTYKRKKTKEWLESFNNDFSELVKWYGIEDIFVKKMKNGYYKVYDLEVGNGSESFINELPKICNKWSWSQKYYNNLKNKVLLFKNK